MSLKVQEMRERLGFNKQFKSGKKQELQSRIADYILHGALPPCPKCGSFPVKEAADPEIGFFCPVTYKGKCDWQSKTVERIPWTVQENKLI